MDDQNIVDSQFLPIPSLQGDMLPLDLDSLPIPNILGLQLGGLPLEQRLEVIDSLGDYLYGDSLKFDELPNRSFDPSNSKIIIAEVPVHGIVLKHLGEVFDASGVAKHPVITLIKIQGGDTPKILTFQSFAATQWASMLIATFQTVGDFPLVRTYKILSIPAKVGHTYRFIPIRKGIGNGQNGNVK